MKENIAVLGSTGSIGTQTLEVARNLNIKVSAISGNKNIALLERQAREFKPNVIAVYDENNAKELKENIRDLSSKVVYGMEGLCEISFLPKTTPSTTTEIVADSVPENEYEESLRKAATVLEALKEASL